jgi:hypothetical protein
MKQISFASLFQTEELNRDNFLARLFGMFSGDLIRTSNDEYRQFVEQRKKWCRIYDDEKHAQFITFSCYKRRKLLNFYPAKRIVIVAAMIFVGGWRRILSLRDPAGAVHAAGPP